MTTYPFNLDNVDPSWKDSVISGLAKLDTDYLKQLTSSSDWLPGPDKIFNAFSLPLNQVNYVLFGESPYPRAESANGYAFWDANVKDLWSPTGLSKSVNRATSLRNIIKMLLIAQGSLKPSATGQEDIAKINKTSVVQTNNEFFTNLIHHGFLLLNASPVLQAHNPQKDARAWQPFIGEVLKNLLKERPRANIILFGRIAKDIDKWLVDHPAITTVRAEHPYNISFITNPHVTDFFKPLNLLKKI